MMRLHWWNIWLWKRAADREAAIVWPGYPKIGTMLTNREILEFYVGAEPKEFIWDEVDAAGEERL